MKRETPAPVREPGSEHRAASAKDSVAGAGAESSTWPIRRMAHVVDRHLANIARALRPQALTAPMWRVLNGLHELERPTIGDLAEHAVFERSYVSRVIARMQKLGLVKVIADDLDRRVKVVQITEKGRVRHTAALEVVRALNREAVSGLTAKDQAKLSDMLNRMANNMGAGAL